MENIDDRRIGQQIRMYRGVRGLTQQQLADTVGISKAAIANYESGYRPVDSRQLLYDLAAALQVTVGDLTGHAEDKINPRLAAFYAQVPAIEAALMAAGDDDTYPLRSVNDLVDDTRRIVIERGDMEYDAIGAILPRLITDLYRHTRADNEQTQLRAWDMLTGVTFGTALTLKALNNASLAWIAARACEEAADKTGDVGGRAAAVYVKSQIQLATATATEAAHRTVTHGIEELREDLVHSGPADTELAGMLHLHAALTTAVTHGDPQDHLAEASALTSRIGDSTRYGLYFAEPNVNVWKMSVANEWQEYGKALKISNSFDPESIRLTERKYRYYMEVGRAHAYADDHRLAMHALLRAEHIDPQRARANTNVREVVGYMMRSAQRSLADGELGRLARRVGVLV